MLCYDLAIKTINGGDIVIRPRKEHQAFSLRMDKAVYDKLCDFCEKTGQMKTVAVERALLMYMESYEKNMCELFAVRKDEGK